MSYETRVTVVLLATMFSAYCGGYLACYTKYQSRMKEAQKRADAAYRRYWNGYDNGDWF